jgi:hypothetical protein
MKKFLSAAILPVVLIPALLLGACTKKTSAVTDTSAVAETTVGVDTSSVDTATATATATADSTVAGSVGASAETTVASGSADTTVASSSADSVSADSKSADSKPAAASVPADTAPTEALSNVSIQPGQSTDKFVGAASDVTTDVCKPDGAGWTASGKVKNSSGAAANYRIYVALNRKGSTDTRALLQVDKSVADGKTEPWEVKAAVTDADLICIMRVERTAAK